MSRDIRQLIGKLGPECKRALERAANACAAATHGAVLIEHLMLQFLDPPEGDWGLVLGQYGIVPEAAAQQLRRALEGEARGATRTPTLDSVLLDAIEEGWVVASLTLQEAAVRPGALLLAILQRDTCRSALVEACPRLLAIPREDLATRLRLMLTPGSAAPAGGTELEQYTIDLTAQAREGKLDPILGRDAELEQVIDILMRRRQNNPLLVGEPGVGKTAVAEALAQRIAAGTVPGPLKAMAVRSLDLGLLQAGAGVRGEFEQRLKSVVAAVSNAPVILFIDEAHTLIGAGGQAGQGDAANLLKPALARGELRCIAATTWAEYKRHVEKDPALARRFQVVKVAEPADPVAVRMLRGVAAKLEAHHGVRITEDAVAAAVLLTSRYISGRQQPDKALSVLDTACARAAVARDAQPSALLALADRQAAIAEERTRLHREARVGAPHGPRLAVLAEDGAAVAREHQALTTRWAQERALVVELQTLLAATEPPAALVVAALRQELAAVQGEAPMVPVEVDARLVGEVVAGWTGIPVGGMLKDDLAAVLEAAPSLARRVIGQDQALEVIARRLRSWRAGLADPGKPAGVFLLCGPTGVGKTETAQALADLLFGGERGLVTISMSEFQEPHSVALLKGAPPGYVGYGQGGVLTEAVRRQPYSVVLLDELEKAHPDVTDLFYQVFDKGRLEDSEGVEVDFRHSVIVMTANLGAERIEALVAAGETDADALAEAIRPDLLARFKLAFLARCTIVPYLPLAPETVARVVNLKLAKVAARLAGQHRARVGFAPAVAEAVLGQCLALPGGGARLADQVMEKLLLPQLAEAVLLRLARGEGFAAVEVDLDAEGGVACRFEAAA
jgi:type VI secretion system protein VasG